MKKLIKMRLPSFILLLIACFGCNKDKRSYYVIGKYSCEVTESSVIYNPYTTSVSKSQQTIEIKKKCCKKGKIEVLGDVIIIDDSKHYSGKHKLANNFYIRFINDSLYINYGSGGMGGWDNTSYKGVEIN